VDKHLQRDVRSQELGYVTGPDVVAVKEVPPPPLLLLVFLLLMVLVLLLPLLQHATHAGTAFVVAAAIDSLPAESQVLRPRGDA
jgi:hypothetical protein